MAKECWVSGIRECDVLCCSTGRGIPRSSDWASENTGSFFDGEALQASVLVDFGKWHKDFFRPGDVRIVSCVGINDLCRALRSRIIVSIIPNLTFQNTYTSLFPSTLKQQPSD